jgi:hypothetical protein
VFHRPAAFESDDNFVSKTLEKLSEETKELIKQDAELHFLIGKLNYNYKKL